MQPFTSLPVQTRDATTISRDRAVNRSFLKNSVCRDSFMYLFTLSLIRKHYSVKFYFWVTTVYENKVIKKRPWLGSLGLKSNRLSQAGPIQTREGKTANFRWLFCLWIEKLCPLSLATSYSISEDSVLAFLIHLPALMFAFWRKKNFTFLFLGVVKELPCRWSLRRRFLSSQIFQRGPRLRLTLTLKTTGSPGEAAQAWGLIELFWVNPWNWIGSLLNCKEIKCRLSVLRRGVSQWTRDWVGFLSDGLLLF